MKIVINTGRGRWFGLSKQAEEFIAERKNVFPESITFRYIDRTDPDLIVAVETLGNKANGEYAELKIVEIPDNVEWEIAEYDGTEWVAEKHRTWS